MKEIRMGRVTKTVLFADGATKHYTTLGVVIGTVENGFFVYEDEHKMNEVTPAFDWRNGMLIGFAVV